MAKEFNRGVVAAADDDGFQTRDVTGSTNPVYPQVNRRTATVTTKTSDYTILPSQLNSIFDNAGDNGTTVLTLPTVKISKGKTLLINALAAQILRALPVAGEAIVNDRLRT